MYNACALANVMGVRVRMYVRVLYRGIFHSQPSPSVDSSACMCTKQKGTRYIVYMHTNVCVLLARLVHISFGGGDSHRGVFVVVWLLSVVSLRAFGCWNSHPDRRDASTRTPTHAAHYIINIIELI